MGILLAYIAVVVILAVVALFLFGAYSWRRDTTSRIARIQTIPPHPPATTDTDSMLAELPDPVARYFRYALRDGHCPIVGAQIRHEGQFQTGNTDRTWKHFTSTQYFKISPPGFVWDARIAMLPGVAVHVRDSYIAGTGAMRGAIAGLIPVVNIAGTPEMAAGCLQRYLAESVWFPTALLPREGLGWSAIDNTTARATLTDGKTTVSLDFTFNAAGEIVSTYTPSRFREIHGAYEPTPWLCHYTAYAETNGTLIPMKGEVEWHLPNLPLPYWRGRITAISYEF